MKWSLKLRPGSQVLCSQLMVYETHVSVQCEHRKWCELCEWFEVKAGESTKPQAVKKEAGVHCLLVLHSLVSFSFFGFSLLHLNICFQAAQQKLFSYFCFNFCEFALNTKQETFICSMLYECSSVMCFNNTDALNHSSNVFF